MEKKLRHKKTGEIAYYKDGILKSGQCCVEIGTEPSNEIWEEVIDKDFEIKSFIGTKNCLEFEGRIVYKIRDKYYLESVNYDRVSINNLSDEEILKTKRWEIHSIQRIIDGEIFTIGDRINYEEDDIPSEVIIEEFQIHNNKIFINSHYNAAHLLNRELSNWKKSKPKPLFTTQDGYKVFRGDEYYFVDVEFRLSSNIATFEWKNKLSFVKYFKEKTNAEWYIFQNKPVLSYNDVWKTLGQGKDIEANVCIYKNLLQQLVKSKL